MKRKLFAFLILVASCCLLCASCLSLTNEARLNAGILHFENKKYPEALALFHELADGGNADACYYLGKMYRDGLGVQKDADKALVYFGKIVETERLAVSKEMDSLYTVRLDLAAANYNEHKYHNAIIEYQKIPKKYYRGSDFGNLGDIYSDVNYYNYNLDTATDYYDAALRHGYQDASVGLNRIDMMIGDPVGGFNRILEYFNRTNSHVALQALIDSPVLGKWNYVGLTDDYIVLSSRDVTGTTTRKLWTYYYPKRKGVDKSKELSSYLCGERKYTIHATATFDDNENITRILNVTDKDVVYVPVAAGAIGENIYDYACFSINKAEAIK